VRATIAATLAAVAAGSGTLAIAGGSDRVLRQRLGPLRSPSRSPALLTTLGSWPVVRRVRISDASATHLALSGMSIDARGFAASKALSALCAAAVCVVTVPVFLPVSVLAFRCPDLLVSRSARRRLRAANREVPMLLDLLAVATSAGLPPQLAFRKAVEAAEGPLVEELRPMLNATALGGRWRDELRTVSVRLALPDLQQLVNALTLSETLGTPLAEEIPRLAHEVREARRASATERARAAPVKMLFPLVFLILPAFLLLTVVPVLVTTVRSIG